MALKYYTAAAQWPGETAFVVAGGTSVDQYKPLDCLRGRKVVAINSSIKDVPFADVLYFGDTRWFNHHRKNLADFCGRIVTVSAIAASAAGVDLMKKRHPPGLSKDRQELTARRTSLVPVINLLAHYGVKVIVLLGADGGPGADGRTHHHDRHPWPLREDCWDQQRADLESICKPLQKIGITVLNASPGTKLDLWPVVKLEDVLCQRLCV